LTPEIVSPLAALTEQSIGKNLDIRIGGQLVDRVSHHIQALDKDMEGFK
jgi:hypothetical protein